jgi:hypothetical protein
MAVTDPKEEAFEKWLKHKYINEWDALPGRRANLRMIFDSVRADLEAKIKRLEGAANAQRKAADHLAGIINEMIPQRDELYVEIIFLRSELDKAVELLDEGEMLWCDKHDDEQRTNLEWAAWTKRKAEFDARLSVFLQSQKGDSSA